MTTEQKQKYIDALLIVATAVRVGYIDTNDIDDHALRQQAWKLQRELNEEQKASNTVNLTLSLTELEEIVQLSRCVSWSNEDFLQLMKKVHRLRDEHNPGLRPKEKPGLLPFMMVVQVSNATGCSKYDAQRALITAKGDVAKAIAIVQIATKQETHHVDLADPCRPGPGI